jgi:hypothetical protein
MPKDKEPLTPVIFRAWKKDGSVIAIFPTLVGKLDPNTCESYMHVGQHSAASADLLGSRALRPALPSEYRALHAELRSIGYRLRTYKRATARMHRDRLAALETMRGRS